MEQGGQGWSDLRLSRDGYSKPLSVGVEIAPMFDFAVEREFVCDIHFWKHCRAECC